MVNVQLQYLFSHKINWKTIFPKKQNNLITSGAKNEYLWLNTY